VRLTRSSTFEAERRSEETMLLLPPSAFALGLLRTLLRRRLRLRFLRHAALLAMMRWRCRNSALANRRALHSAYYSTTEKTATPLKEVCTRRRAARPPSMQMEARIAACTHLGTSSEGISRVYLLITIQPVKYDFFGIMIY